MIRISVIVVPVLFLFGGSSGGSIFLSASFLPLFGDKLSGAWALSCGGDAPWAGGLAWDGKDPALASANKLFFTYGDKDVAGLQDPRKAGRGFGRPRSWA